MTMNGIGGVQGGLGLPGLQPRPPRESEERRPIPADAPRIAPPGVQATETDTVLSAAPPSGTDPAFWSVLTTEERAFFSKMQALGPLTYGPRSVAPQAAVARGGRIDLKV